jgi:hypothetical protein
LGHADAFSAIKHARVQTAAVILCGAHRIGNMTLEQISQLAAVFGVVVPLAALAWSAVMYVRIKRTEIQHQQYQKVFEVMDNLGKEGGSIASKMAAAFELRKFPEYSDVILRLASQVEITGSSVAATMLKNEIALTADFLKSKE